MPSEYFCWLLPQAKSDAAAFLIVDIHAALHLLVLRVYSLLNNVANTSWAMPNNHLF